MQHMHVALHVAHCGAILLANRALLDTFYPTVHPPTLCMKRQTIYLVIIDTYSLRQRADFLTRMVDYSFKYQ